MQDENIFDIEEVKAQRAAISGQMAAVAAVSGFRMAISMAAGQSPVECGVRYEKTTRESTVWGHPMRQTTHVGGMAYLEKKKADEAAQRLLCKRLLKAVGLVILGFAVFVLYHQGVIRW